jgi:hypothetical protein
MKCKETYRVADTSKTPRNSKGAVNQTFGEDGKRLHGLPIRNGANHTQARFSPTHINRLQLQNAKTIRPPGAAQQELRRKLAGAIHKDLQDGGHTGFWTFHPVVGKYLIRAEKHWASEIFPGILGRMIRWLTLVLHQAVAGLKSRPNLPLEILPSRVRSPYYPVASPEEVTRGFPRRQDRQNHFLDARISYSQGTGARENDSPEVRGFRS